MSEIIRPFWLPSDKWEKLKTLPSDMARETLKYWAETYGERQPEKVKKEVTPPTKAKAPKTGYVARELVL